MSLINRMLADLDERRSGLSDSSEHVLTDLVHESPRGMAAASWRRVAVAGLLLVGGVAGALSGHWVRQVADARDRPAPPPATMPPAARVPVNAAAAEPGITLSLGTDPAVLAALATLSNVASNEPRPPRAAAHAPNDSAEETASAGAGPEDEAAAPPPIALVMEAESVPLARPSSGTAAADADSDASAAAAETPTPRISRTPATAPAPKPVDRYASAQRALERGDARRAVGALTALLNDDPDATDARLLLARVYLKQGRRGEARALLEAGLARDPRQAPLADLLARMLLDAGDPAAAAATLRRAPPALASAPEYHAFLAAVEQRLERHAAAIAIYRDILAVVPDNGVWWLGLAISLSAAGERTGAMDAFMRSLTDPGLSPDLREYVNSEMRRLDAVSG